MSATGFEPSTNGLKGQGSKPLLTVQEPTVYTMVHWTILGCFFKVSQQKCVQWICLP